MPRPGDGAAETTGVVEPDGPGTTHTDLVRAHLPDRGPAAVASEADQRRLTIAALRARSADLGRLRGEVDEALSALEAGDDGERALEVIAEAAARTVPRWHFAMLNDHDRTSGFTAAIHGRIAPGSHVLDIGTGSGLLAMIAVEAGAARVTTCESNPLLAELAEQIIAAHGMSDRITVLNRASTELRAGEDMDPADAIVSEIVDCGLVGENMFSTMRHARRELLAPGGVMVPAAAQLHAFAVDSPVAVGLNRVGTAGEFDVRLFNLVSTRRHFPIRLSTWPYRSLTSTRPVAAFDLLHDPLADGSRRLRLDVLEGGDAHGLVVWFELELSRGIVLRNAPSDFRSHWMQALLLFENPVTVGPGGVLDVEVAWQGDVLSADVVEVYP